MKYIKHKLLPAFYAWVCKILLSLLAKTYRFHVHGLEEFITTAQNKRIIVAFWHNRLLMMFEILKRAAPQFHYAALISQSRDGEVIARITTSYKQGRSIRVPHDGRSEAFRTLVTHLKYGNEILLITPDGPRGPCYEVKPGIIHAAQESGSCIIPVHWEASKSWSFSTWDSLQLPKPFAHIVINFGKPLQHHPDNSIETTCQKLKDALRTQTQHASLSSDL